MPPLSTRWLASALCRARKKRRSRCKKRRQNWPARIKRRHSNRRSTIIRKANCPKGTNCRVAPVIGASPTRVSVDKVRKQLAQTHQIHLTYTTLQRYLTRLGYRPKDRIHQPPSTEGEWTKPWPRAYGESLADYLSK